MKNLVLILIAIVSTFVVTFSVTTSNIVAAPENLYVSAENSNFKNKMSGPQVIEVIVRDPSISDTGQGRGEPDVTVNGAKLRMAQAVDGAWYGYFADRKMALIADSTVTLAGKGLDFGTFCSRTTSVLGFSVTDTAGIAIPVKGVGVGGQNGTSDAPQISADCTFTNPKTDGITNVVRSPTQINTNVASIGQTGLQSSELWPFIQLYDLTKGGNVVIKYNKGGGAQSTTLIFDTVDEFAKLVLDRESFPRSANLNVLLTDPALNIDPTDEDTWTFGTNLNEPSVFYRLFSENGEAESDGTAGAADINSALDSLMFKQNGVLKVNPKAQGTTSDVVTIRDNRISQTNGNGVLPISLVSTSGGSVPAGRQPVTISETSPNTGIFSTSDNSNNSVLVITSNAARGTSATITYNERATSILVKFSTATISLESVAKGKEWNSGEKLAFILTDPDANKNSLVKEDLVLSNPDSESIPSLSTGDPFTLGETGVEGDTKIKASFIDGFVLTPTGTTGLSSLVSSTLATKTTTKVEQFSERAKIVPVSTADVNALVIDLRTDIAELRKSINNPFDVKTGKFRGLNMLNYDLRSINSTISSVQIYLLVNQSQTGTIISDSDGSVVSDLKAISLANTTTLQNLVNLNSTVQIANPKALHELLFGNTVNEKSKIGLMFTFPQINNIGTFPRALVTDFFSFGFTNEGMRKTDRITNQIIRIEASEVENNSSTFRGSLEYILLNQINIFDVKTYENVKPTDDEPNFIVLTNLDGKDSPKINYRDLAEDGSVRTVSGQQEVKTHRGTISLDKKNYKAGDTVTITLNDPDLNVDSDIIDIYTVVDPSKFPNDSAVDAVGKENLGLFSSGDSFGSLVEVTIGGERWVKSNVLFAGKKCSENISGADGLFSSGFTLIETGQTSGVFVGSFKIPNEYCSRSQGGKIVLTTGVDIDARYVDFLDASGQTVKTSTGSSISGTTGYVTLDRTVYPIPFGSVKDFFSDKTPSAQPDGKSIFPVHHTAITKNGDLSKIDAVSEELGPRDLVIYVSVSDPDFNLSPRGEDEIAQNLPGKQYGPVKISISRGSTSIVLATAGGEQAREGVITLGKEPKDGITREIGPLREISPASGVFKIDLNVRYTDGPSSTICPVTPSDKFTPLDKSKNGVNSRFESPPAQGSYCILDGDVITVEYTDISDSSGATRRVTDSAVFDLRNGALRSDKSVYIIGSDMILTLIEPDFDLDSETAEVYNLDLIGWDSDAGRVSMGVLGGSATNRGKIFDPEPSALRESGKSSGIFQTVIEIPQTLGSKSVDRGEKIELEYTDWGPSGARFVGFEDFDSKLTIFTSNFGATIELDKKVYTWTDKVYITIVAPDHNFDANRIDQVGGSSNDEITVSTRASKLTRYKLSETSQDSGVFTGTVILTGFKHDADGDPRTGNVEGVDTIPRTTPRDSGGPNNGFLESKSSDGLTVSFKSNERQIDIGSALIRWNIGDIRWMDSQYTKNGIGIVQIIDPDMNLNPEVVDNFKIDVWSDTDKGGISFTVVETGTATGIFEGKIQFTTSNPSSGSRLLVSQGDFVTAKYEDNTLPSPYTTANELKITAETYIGTLVPPLERIPATSPRVTDLSGNTLQKISVDQQILVKADLTNRQEIEGQFAYIVQIQDKDDITLSAAWITGSLKAGQSVSPSLSWIPEKVGQYKITLFVWNGIDNPIPLSPISKINIVVN